MATTQPGGRYISASGEVVDANGKPIVDAQPEAVTVATPEPQPVDEGEAAPAPKKRAKA